MNTKTYLGQVQRLDKIIQNKAEDLMTLQELAISVGGINYDKDCVQTSTDPDKIGRTVAKIMDMEEEKGELICQYLERRNQIEGQISNIPNINYYNVLYKKFILGKSLEKISKELPCGIATAKRYYGKALKIFEEMYGELYLDKNFDLYFKVDTK